MQCFALEGRGVADTELLAAAGARSELQMKFSCRTETPTKCGGCLGCKTGRFKGVCMGAKQKLVSEILAENCKQGL